MSSSGGAGAGWVRDGQIHADRRWACFFPRPSSRPTHRRFCLAHKSVPQACWLELVRLSLIVLV